jgi:uncharacterized membrane protein YkoI
MFRSKILQMTAVALIALGSAGAAYAESDDHDANSREEITTMVGANTSLAQAVAAAEQQTGGKAVESRLAQQNGAMAYEIKVANGDTYQNVLVNADSGKVIKVTAAEDAQHEDDDYDGD